MEKFAVDLDKVLDEFELNEDRADEIAAGKESCPSGYQEYLNATRENFYPYQDCVPLVEPLSRCSDKELEKNFAAGSVRYDFPFKPVDKINLQDVDFASKSSISSYYPSGESSHHNRLDAVFSQDPVQRSNFFQESKLNNSFSKKPNETRDIGALGPDQQYPVPSQTLPSLSAQNSRNGLASNAYLPTYNSCTVLNKNRIGGVSSSESECLADRLMKDIETVMETGISLSALKFDSQSQEFNRSIRPDTVANVDDSSDTINRYLVSVNNAAFSESNMKNAKDTTEHSVPSESVSKSESNECSDTESKDNLSNIDSKISSKQNFDVADHIADLQECAEVHHVSLEGNDSGTVNSSSLLSDEPTSNCPQEIENDSRDLLKADGIEFKDDESKHRTVDDTATIGDVMSGADKEIIPPVGENILEDQTLVKVVGFSTDVDICDSELEKYLKDAEDSEKVELPKSTSDYIPSENNVEGCISTEEFHPSMLEPTSSHTDLSALDPLFSDKENKSDASSSETNSKMLSSLDINTNPVTVVHDKPNESNSVDDKKIVVDNVSEALYSNTGARPKCLGDSDVTLILQEKNSPGEISAPQESIGPFSDEVKKTCTDKEEWMDRRILHDAINRELAQRTKLPEIHMVKEQQNLEIRNQLHLGTYKNKTCNSVDSTLMKDSLSRNSYQTPDIPSPDQNEQYVEEVLHKTGEEVVFDGSGNLLLCDECYPADDAEEKNVMALKDTSAGSKKKRPTSLNLSGKNALPAEETGLSAQSEEPAIARINETMAEIPPVVLEEGSLTNEPTSSIWDNNDLVTNSLPPVSPLWTEEESRVGLMAPFWIPDAEAPNCMQCNIKFTVIKRRHHCRACGRVLCSQCCASKAKLPYMENKEARVCQQCLQTLNKVQAVEQWNHVSSPTTGSLSNSPLTPLNRFPNPNNPNEYCSTIPPLQQAQANANIPPPTVMVPVGVLKREGTKTRGEPKQVMFSDGIRPGGDLTELDAPVDSKPVFRKQKRTQKKIEKISDDTLSSRPPIRPMAPLGLASPSNHLIPTSMDLFPLIIRGRQANGEYLFEDNSDASELFTNLEDPQMPPVVFAVNKNLLVHVKVLTLDCCVKKTCWCFTTEGMATVGQEELVIILESLPDEKTVPRDLFSYFNMAYEEANQGNTISCLGHTVFTQSFLGSKEHGGFLYIRPTFQCLNKLMLPPHPYLIGILLQKWEIPWAKIFPLRLMLRLGYEFRFYPCPLVSIRFRKPVYSEIGHTIMNLLADFRNYQYKLTTIKGMVIHMEEKRTQINIPKNRYDETMKALNNSNDHVLALGGNFSMEADSHLVCIQNEDGNYQTQAINIENKTRKVTGASFVVFNGALKSSTGLTAKSSIVEDGLMVQILPDTMIALRQSLRDMQNFTIGCGSNAAENPEETVSVSWTDDDKQVNIGVRSPIDGMQMDGIASIHVHGGTDYMDERWLIRWTEVFFIQTDDNINIRRSEPVNMSRLAEILAQACCIALTAHLNSLKETGLTKIGLRVNIDAENVGYEIGSRENKLPSVYMNDLDSELVPVIHRAASQTQEGPITLELVFHIMEQ